MNAIEVKEAMANVKATLEVEKLRVSKKSEEITRLYLEDKLTSQEAIDLIKGIYEVED
jgi:hypothetical protein